MHVDSLHQTAAAKQKTENRAFIGHLINTLVFVGRLGIPYRGHRYNGWLAQLPNSIKDIDISKGKFPAILQLHSMGNKAPATFWENSTSNPSYHNQEMQNQLISLIGSEILSVISSEIRAAPGFAVIAAETSDLFGQSQLCIAIRNLSGNTLVAVSYPNFGVKIVFDLNCLLSSCLFSAFG